MPLEKTEAWTRHPPISLKNWKNRETEILTFQDEGKDIQTPNGLSYLYHVTQKGSKELKELWVRPGGPLAIALSPHVPLRGLVLKVTKTTGAQPKDTRYVAVPDTGKT